MTTLRDLSDHLPVVTHLLDALLTVAPWRPSLRVSRTRLGRPVEAAPGDAYVTATDAASSRARDRARDAQLHDRIPTSGDERLAVSMRQRPPRSWRHKPINAAAS